MVYNKNIKTQLRKGVINFLVLSVIKNKSSYPREVIEKLSMAGFDIVEGTLYPLFLRLTKQNLVSYEWREAGGHPRKYYSLTPLGKNVLNVYEKEWGELINIIKKIA